MEINKMEPKANSEECEVKMFILHTIARQLRRPENGFNNSTFIPSRLPVSFGLPIFTIVSQMSNSGAADFRNPRTLKKIIRHRKTSVPNIESVLYESQFHFPKQFAPQPATQLLVGVFIILRG